MAYLQMNGELIAAFLQKHWSWALLVIGAVLLIGVIMNWNWLCDPTGKPYSQRYGPCEPTDKGGRLAELGKSRRVMFFLLGVVLIAVSIWSLAIALN